MKISSKALISMILVLLIVMGGAGSALLLGLLFGVWLIVTGLQQWRIAVGPGADQTLR